MKKKQLLFLVALSSTVTFADSQNQKTGGTSETHKKILADLQARIEADNKAYRKWENRMVAEGYLKPESVTNLLQATSKVKQENRRYETFSLSPELCAIPAITNALPVHTTFTIVEKTEAGTSYWTVDRKCCLSFPDTKEDHDGKLTIKSNGSSWVFHQDPENYCSFYLPTTPKVRYTIFKVSSVRLPSYNH